ncbi:hypothetical protein HAX54_017209 [Datura stramonium]|uniref:Uncharacterized protein n=1 Tax=Datura stramonium TaxID=4076 RepID=A0ABS8UK90_DATST|nr:hypothetical protein [Datura stramonium]
MSWVDEVESSPELNKRHSIRDNFDIAKISNAGLKLYFVEPTKDKFATYSYWNWGRPTVTTSREWIICFCWNVSLEKGGQNRGESSFSDRSHGFPKVSGQLWPDGITIKKQ